MEDHRSRPPIPTWFFVLVVVRAHDRFLLVQESRPGNPWYIPAGRVEPGEGIVAAAERETLEETGVPAVVEHVIRVDHTPLSDGTARVRVYLSARPKGETAPKRMPDEDSLGAGWFTLEEMGKLPLRGPEALRLCRYVAEGGALYSLDILDVEPFSS
jgi:ADP-ribose pyrophosphatase YjhB (NUDIX family)